jgi:hypothetical protein
MDMEPDEYDVTLSLIEIKELIDLAKAGAICMGNFDPYPQIILDLREIHEELTSGV